MTRFLPLILLFSTTLLRSQSSADTLYVNYYSQVAFAQEVNGEVKGLEIDIINNYITWLKSRKQMDVTVKYVKFNDFDQFYSKTRAATKNTIGLGSVTVNAERRKEVDFTPAYLKNVSFCVTNGNAPDIKAKNHDEIVKVLGSMTGLTLANSTLNKHLEDLRKAHLPELKIQNRQDEVKIMDEIARNVLYFGYVDAVSFWSYLKSNPSKFLKNQKTMSLSQEELAFVLPKGSKHLESFNEFFNGAAGFRKSKEYTSVLERHLGTYMTSVVAIK